MTIPIRLTPADIDPLEQLKALKAQQPPVDDDPLAKLIALQHATNQAAITNRPPTSADATSALPYDPNRPGDLQAIGQGLAASGANIATSLPGSMPVASAIRAVIRGQPYRQAYTDLNAAKQSIPQPIRAIENIVGSGPLALLPGSPIQVGAAAGALDALTDANPDRGLASRLGGAVTGAIGGALGGKVGELAGTGARIKSTPLREDQLVAREAQQSANATPLYDAAIAQGQGLTNTDPNIARVMNLPTLKAGGDVVRANDDLMSIPAGNSPEFLDKVFKGLSDDETSLQGRLDALDKGDKSANGIRQQLENVQGLKKVMLEEMSGQNGPMPSYAQAVNQFATDQAGINALKRGYSTLSNVSAPLHGGVNQVENTAAGAARWAPTASPDEMQAFTQGAMARAKEVPAATIGGRFRVPFPGKSVRALPDLFRRIGDPAQESADQMSRILGGATASPFAGYDPTTALNAFIANHTPASSQMP